MLGELELVIDAKATLGEGPSWDSKKHLLYWVDILEKKVHIYNRITGENKSIFLGQMVGSVVPRKSGGMVLALEKGFYFLNPDTEEMEAIYDPESHLEENRFNDGKCDPCGRFWAGTTDSIGINGKGALYFLNTNLHVKKKLEQVSTSNGLAWSPDHMYMYFIDTPTRKVVRFDYDVHTGHIENPQDVIVFPKEEGLPDGMTIDGEGMLWIAHWGGSKVSRWNPKSGKQLLTIPIPALYVTSCTFGGSNLNELYITTARMNNTNPEIYPNAGGIFRMKTNIKGCPTYQFNS
ncbi:SMP-30/gluconolactonase/LRE family protein [Bacillus cereus group sp. BceL296]|uniref:SMP-30/gluconolactonase/LRE family protein n=1 Tax=Bacillus cereus group TaxID=86661 RepID=UPI00065BF3CB|nr:MULTISPECIES: SMP-30/gluconolactonase/LRE family protein [Bacillus cereus group]KMQ13440.1 SMP-30/gluconolaconase/LRE domain protein [Bacillus cereus]MCU5391895.1 SMP-30/gluconolactonase/LRE family protein [Bacillus paranthracis]MDA1624138.1 SMP-30/gluconolactonase/LRE family protein [Bacillus cereus group sp. TH206-1LC]MDA1751255.1 SMP-30/gluconolactonase/LRE family protein [Bacillus cereus group sp. LD113LC]MDA1823416.1 SMP-30/gluconolactonase/LRE family protein [Bacillus cereus group sp.